MTESEHNGSIRETAPAVTRKAAVPDTGIVTLAVAAAAAALIGVPLIALLACLTIAVTLLARLWTRLALEEVTYACRPLFSNVMEGEVFGIAMSVENNKPLPVPWLRISQFIPRGLDIVESDAVVGNLFGGVTMGVVTHLGRHERLTVMHRLRAARRGHFDLNSAALTGGDLFGLYDTRRDLNLGSVRLVAFPRIVPLPDFDLPSARPTGDASSRRQLIQDQNWPATLRDYVPGDPMKWIDWKALARCQRLYVKRFEPSTSQHVVVLLECGTGGETASGWSDRPWLLEAAARAAASVAYRAAELGYGVGLVANGVPPGHHVQAIIRAGHGPRHLSGVLQALACVQSAVNRPLEDLIGERGGDTLPIGATIVLVAGTYRPATVRFVQSLARYGHRLVTVDIGGDRPPAVAELNVRDYRFVFGSPEREGARGIAHA